jgi:hypothetical protein
MSLQFPWGRSGMTMLDIDEGAFSYDALEEADR